MRAPNTPTTANGITQYLANRYGNTSSSHYSADVVGFGINEPPPPDNTSPPDYNPALEQIQSTMLTWIRGTNGSGGNAPQWIGFVAYAWANQAPIFNAPDESSNCSDCIPANPKAYNSVGNNVILDFHDYFMGCIPSVWTSISADTNVADCDGRNNTGGTTTTPTAATTSPSETPATPATPQPVRTKVPPANSSRTTSRPTAPTAPKRTSR